MTEAARRRHRRCRDMMLGGSSRGFTPGSPPRAGADHVRERSQGARSSGPASRPSAPVPLRTGHELRPPPRWQGRSPPRHRGSTPFATWLGALSERVADRWADRLRYGGLDPDKVRRGTPTLNERVRARARLPADWAELVLLTSGVLAVHSASAAPGFPLDLVHMHINRPGLNPLEECLAAHLCETSPTTTQGDTHHDHPEPGS